MEPEDVLPELRAALSAHVSGDEGGAAAQLLRLRDRGGAEAVAVAQLLDLAGLAWRHQIRASDKPVFFELSALVARLIAEGTVVPAGGIEALSDFIIYTAAIAGGIRPPIQPLLDRHRGAGLLEAAWLTFRTALRVAAMNTEGERIELVGIFLAEYRASS